MQQAIELFLEAHPAALYAAMAVLIVIGCTLMHLAREADRKEVTAYDLPRAIEVSREVRMYLYTVPLITLVATALAFMQEPVSVAMLAFLVAPLTVLSVLALLYAHFTWVLITREGIVAQNLFRQQTRFAWADAHHIEVDEEGRRAARVALVGGRSWTIMSLGNAHHSNLLRYLREQIGVVSIAA